MDHVRYAVTHLTEDIGIGDHGLIKVGDGDWSDGVVIENAKKKGFPAGLEWFFNSKEKGESIPNTQMALYVLPLIAALVETRDSALASNIRDFLKGLPKALQKQWTGEWYTRAILYDENESPVVLGDDKIMLESQPWALIANLGNDQQIKTLTESIKKHLDDPSKIGAMLEKDGMVWPAVSQLLTWGYAHCNYPDLAWGSLERHTLAVRAKHYGKRWFNVWSGPDGVNEGCSKPGDTWKSEVTPMTDFPVMNMNQHAMALLGLLRVCGIEPSPNGDGLIIAPQVPGSRFVLDLPLLSLQVEPERIAGEYRPGATCENGRRILYVRIPEGANTTSVSVGGRQPDNIPRTIQHIALPIDFDKQAVPFEVSWSL
jgi:hypothetical protein